MHFGKEIVKKKKKALLGLAAGTLMSALVAIPLYILTGQALTLTILGLGADIGFSVGGGGRHRLHL